MKTQFFPRRVALAPSTWLSLFAPVIMTDSPAQTAIPSIPVGTLSAYPTVVVTGTKPTLNWSIVYPSTLTDVAIVNPPGTVIVNQTVYVSVQPVCTAEDGSCFDSLGVAEPVRPLAPALPGIEPAPTTVPTLMLCSTTPQPPPPAPVDIRVSVNGSAYDQLFYGTNADVNPAKRLFVKKLQSGQAVNFGGRYTKFGAWSPFYTTRSANLQVITLTNGSVIPTNSPLFQQAYLSPYLRPYLDASGKVSIGPMSALVMMELNETNHTDSCFDYQDAILIITLSKNHPNNGHGNNLDGVDSSNPGGGSGGPNGEIDPSGGVDDEIR